MLTAKLLAPEGAPVQLKAGEHREPVPAGDVGAGEGNRAAATSALTAASLPCRISAISMLVRAQSKPTGWMLALSPLRNSMRMRIRLWLSFSLMLVAWAL